MSQVQIKVDPDRLGSIAASVSSARAALETSPFYVNLEGGDRAQKLAHKVGSFISANKRPREDLIKTLDVAAKTLDAAAKAFQDTESSLINALKGEV